MKQKFSTAWAGSKQPRKQRKYRYNSPFHVRHRFLSANLSKELRKKHGKRSVPVRKGDEVLIMRGKFAKKKGKVLEADLKKGRVSIENINRAKKDGTKINVFLNPSNLQIVSLNLDDAKRIKRNRAGGKIEKKKEVSKEHSSVGKVNNKVRESDERKQETEGEKKDGTS